MNQIVVVDMKALLDRSRAGVEGAQRLEKQWREAEAEFEKRKTKAVWATGAGAEQEAQKLAEFERESRLALETKRAKLRERVLDAAEPIIKALAAERGAVMVLERSAVLHLTDPGADITEAVLAKLDAA